MDSGNEFISRRVAKEFRFRWLPTLAKTKKDKVLRTILSHFWKDGVLYFHAQYMEANRKKTTIDAPFGKLRICEPVLCARYIREYFAESRRGERPFNDWADRILQQENCPKIQATMDVFLGTVKLHSSGSLPLWFIQYDDGDEEELDYGDLKQALNLYEKFKKFDFLPAAGSDNVKRASIDNKAPPKRNCVKDGEESRVISNDCSKQNTMTDLKNTSVKSNRMKKEGKTDPRTITSAKRKGRSRNSSLTASSSTKKVDVGHVETIDVTTNVAKHQQSGGDGEIMSEGEDTALQEKEAPCAERRIQRQNTRSKQSSCTEMRTRTSVANTGENTRVQAHFWDDDDILYFQVRHVDTPKGDSGCLKPFENLKREEPFLCATYINKNVPTKRRGGRLANSWAKKELQKHPSRGTSASSTTDPTILYEMESNDMSVVQPVSKVSNICVLEKPNEMDSNDMSVIQPLSKVSNIYEVEKPNEMESNDKPVVHPTSKVSNVGVVEKRCSAEKVSDDESGSQNLPSNTLTAKGNCAPDRRVSHILCTQVENTVDRESQKRHQTRKRKMAIVNEPGERREVGGFRDRRMNNDTGKEEYLIKWRNHSESCNTWEHPSDLNVEKEASEWWKQEKARRNIEILSSSDSDSDEEVQVVKDPKKWQKKIAKYALVAGELPDSYNTDDE